MFNSVFFRDNEHFRRRTVVIVIVTTGDIFVEIPTQRLTDTMNKL